MKRSRKHTQIDIETLYEMLFYLRDRLNKIERMVVTKKLK